MGNPLQTATPEEIALAQRLILQGKERATRGDYRMSRILHAIKNLNQEQVRKAIKEAEARGLDVSNVDVEKKGFGYKITGIIDPTKTTEGQEFLERAGVPSGKLGSEIQREQGAVLKLEPTGETINGVPINKVVFQDLSTGTKRLATQQEAEYFRSQTSRTLEVPEEPKGYIEKSKAVISFERGSTTTTPTRLFIAGVSAGILAPIELGKEFIIDPVATTKNIATGIIKIPSQGAEIGMLLKQQPTFVVGVVGSQALLFKGIGKVGSAVGVQGVIFKGVTQTVQKNVIRTEAVFKTTKGGTGAVRSTTIVNDIGGGISSIKTAGVGVVGRKGFVFPTGQEVIGKIKTFGGGAKGFSRIVGDDISLQVVGGATKRIGKSKLTEFVDVSLGKTVKDTTAIGGATKILNQKGVSGSVGILKKVPVQDKIFDIVGGIGGQSITIQTSKLKSIGLTQAEALVKAGVQPSGTIVNVVKSITPTATITKTIKTPSFKTSVIQEVKQVQIAKPITITKIKGMTIQTQGLVQGQLTQQKQKIAPMQKLSLETAQVPKNKIKLASIINVAQAQPQKLRQLSILKTAQITRPRATPIIPIASPKIPFIPSFRIRKPTSITSRGGFGVAVRRFGTFKTIGTGLSLGKAVSIGAGRTRRTIARSFKIISPKGLGKIQTPKGFRIKREKGSTIFIERTSGAINTEGEIKTLALARRGIKI